MWLYTHISDVIEVMYPDLYLATDLSHKTFH